MTGESTRDLLARLVERLETCKPTETNVAEVHDVLLSFLKYELEMEEAANRSW